MNDEPCFGEREGVGVLVRAEFEGGRGFELALGQRALAVGGRRELDAHLGWLELYPKD